MFLYSRKRTKKVSGGFIMIESLKTPVNLRIFLAYYNFNIAVLGKSKCLKTLDRET